MDSQIPLNTLDFVNGSLKEVSAYVPENDIQNETKSDEESQHEKHPDIATITNKAITNSCSALGLLMIVVHAFCIATNGLIVKFSSFHATQLAAFRGIGQTILIIPFILYNKSSFFGVHGERIVLLLASVVSGLVITLSFLSFENLPLGDASSILFSSPVFTSLLACIFLKEPCGIYLIVTIIIMLSGVVLITKPGLIFGDVNSFEHYPKHITGIACALGNMITISCIIIFARKLQKTHATTSVFGVGIGIFVVSSIIMVALNEFKIPTTLFDGIYVAGIVLSGFIGQISFLKGLQLERAGLVSIVRTINVVFAFVYQIAVFKEIPDWSSIVGSFLIINSVLLTAVKKLYDKNPEIRKLFCGNRIHDI